MKHYGDITKLSGYDLPIVDVITGGSPCQDLSIAGNRAGLAGERSGLFMEQMRIVREMRDADRRNNGRSGQFIRPRFMVWENVPGAFSSNGGKDFGAVLTEIIKVADPKAPDVPLPDGGGSGQTADASTMSWADGQLLGEYMTDSFGEKPCMLTEESSFPALPNGVGESRLSQILVDSPHPKYSLSARACQGILNRAEKRNKALPEALEKALREQAKI